MHIHHFEEQGGDGPYDMEEPNFFGLSIGYDPYMREVVEADELISQRTGMSIPEIFARSGEETFRKLETEVLAEQGKRSGIILSTGGGCVTQAENYPLLHQNGTIFRLTRDLAKLPTEGRPISQATDLAQLCARREPLYRRFADVTVSNDGALEATVQTIKEALL